MYTGHLRKCHIYIFIFHKDHFKPNMSFLSASVQILAVKTHVFWDFGPVRTKRAEGAGQDDVMGQKFFFQNFSHKIYTLGRPQGFSISKVGEI